MVKAKTKGDYTRTKKYKHPWQMWDEKHLEQVNWKEVAKVVERVDFFPKTKANIQLIWKIWMNLSKTRHPSSWRFCWSSNKHDALIISILASAPNVVVMEENWEPNIRHVVAKNEKNKIHQFLWTYKNCFSFSLKDLPCHLRTMKFKLLWLVIHPYFEGLINILTRKGHWINQRAKSCWRLNCKVINIIIWFNYCDAYQEGCVWYLDER